MSAVRPPDRTQLFAALRALRDADDPSASTLSWAWRDVSAWIDTRRRVSEREHDDVRQRTLIKVMGGVHAMEASTEGQADGWLKRVWVTAQAEHHRNAESKLVDAALKVTPPVADVGWIDRLAEAPVFAPDDEDDAARMAELLSRTLDRVHGWLAQHVDKATKREGDYRRAQMALLSNVLGFGIEELRERVGVPEQTSKATVYKWVERGREQVLVPALEGWTDPAAGPLLEVLCGARRADAGRARPARRQPVSTKGARSSVGRKMRHKGAKRAPEPDGKERAVSPEATPSSREVSRGGPSRRTPEDEEDQEDHGW